MLNSTFAENRTGSAIASFSGATTLQNTIVVHNADDEFGQDCFGDITSLGNNLIGDPSGCNITLQPSDLTGDAGLAQLVDDGTPGNARHPLLLDSQAIDAANDAACTKRDQIGRRRKPRCDIGAVEFRRADVIPTTTE